VAANNIRTEYWFRQLDAGLGDDARMQGFIVMDYVDQRDAALADLQWWVASGKLKVPEDVIDGLENTPKALIGLLAGENRGKRMAKV
jgi:NADPH-dependent curcumin reductase CurA